MVEPTRLTEAELARLHALGCVAESGMVEVTGPEVRALVEEVRRLRQERDETLMLAEHPYISNLRDLARELAYRAQRILELEARDAS